MHNKKSIATRWDRTRVRLVALTYLCVGGGSVVWHSAELFVQTEIVPNRVLPSDGRVCIALVVKVRDVRHDPIVNFGQR